MQERARLRSLDEKRAGARVLSRRQAAGMGLGEILSLRRTCEGLQEALDLVRIEV